MMSWYYLQMVTCCKTVTVIVVNGIVKTQFLEIIDAGKFLYKEMSSEVRELWLINAEHSIGRAPSYWEL